MKKKVLFILLISFLLTGVVSAASSIWGEYKGKPIIRLTIDGAPTIVSDAPAVLMDDRTMVPIYLLSQAGIQFTWDGKNQTVDIKKHTSPPSTDPSQITKEIMDLGGGGITLTNVSGSLTGIVYYYAKSDFDTDWNSSMLSIFTKLAKFDTVYSRIMYVVNGQENLIEARTVNIKDYLNGQITNDEMNNLWITSGPIFSAQESTKENQTGTIINYPELYSNDGKTYLGKLTTISYDTDSVFNEYGDYGSKYQTDSIWNNYGDYGSEYSNKSAFNKYATEPPMVVLNGKVIGYLTVNSYINNAISPIGLHKWLEDQGY